MHIEYDPKVKAMYIYINETKIERTEWANESKTIAIDYDENDEVVGIELLYIEEPQEFSYKRLLKRE
jgi:uncharacterized protein YuzE